MIRIGTRGSTLALAQARAVADRLQKAGAVVEVVPMRTEGDRLAEARLAAVGGKGLFVRDLERALLDGAIDVAVHSLKDLPSELPPGLCLGAFPERDDPHDVLVTRAPADLAGLAPGTLVGTSSPRRRAIVLSLRPDLVVQPIRGNVDTRLRKLDGGGWDALVLAAAGLRRLGLEPEHCTRLDAAVFVPAVGQGVLALEAREGDRRTLERLAALDHAATRACAAAERAYLARLGASCVTPMAAHASADGGVLRMSALVASEDGRRVLRASGEGVVAQAPALGRQLAETLLGQGAAAVAALRPVPVGGLAS